ncbi:type II toxin-antitoxin system prevent-host-death family antitoxin [Nonomuraea sp. NBC_00507]|uniref:type II toxin-antitoxin system Phd/YefM family antitoxin n=1 Tax=Nonomuraea sp. NBC_00507 TaxID=2976002 RepID=UPI002E16D1CF
MSPLPADPVPSAPVGIAEVGKSLSRLIDRVETGEQITITRGGRRVAVLTPVPRPVIPDAPTGHLLLQWFEEFGPDEEFAADIDEVVQER